MGDIPVKIYDPGAPVALYAALDWGLGHTTRSIPVIRQLRKLGFSVVIACNSVQKTIFQEAFPELHVVPLEGYHLKFGRTKTSTLLRILLQVPRLLYRVYRENRQARELQQQLHATLLISDNRYGFYSKKVPSVFITHQLRIQSGLSGGVDRLLLRATRFFLRRFRSCWIPDIVGPENLAGTLSAPIANPPCPLVYLGNLSRFDAVVAHPPNDGPILIILSGPEPQRSLLEEKILTQVRGMEGTFILVRGLPQASHSPEPPANLTIYNHLPAARLQQLLLQSRFVISRSGYSSLMDYTALGCKPLLIPTPGQAEQEYLARYWMQQRWAISFTQDDFRLQEALPEARRFTFRKPNIPAHLHTKMIEESLRELGREQTA